MRPWAYVLSSVEYNVLSSVEYDKTTQPIATHCVRAQYTQVEQDKRERRGESLSDEEEAEIRDPILEKFERESSPYYSSSRLWDDGVIDPADTRRVLGLSLRVATKNAPPPTTFGVFRM